MMKPISFILILALAISCSGIKRIDNKKLKAQYVDTTKLYSQAFLDKINAIKEVYRIGQSTKALTQLDALDESTLSGVEIGTKRNLRGVIYFSQKKYDLAAVEFGKVIELAKEDPVLLAQAHLNQGSALYKNNDNVKALEVLERANYKNLNDAEAKKYHQLVGVLSELVGQKDKQIISLVRALEDKRTIAELTSDSRYSQLDELYRKLSTRERVSVIEEFDEDPNLVVAYLAYKEAEVSFNNGDKGRMQDFINWISNRYGQNVEIRALIESLNTRVENKNVKINSKLIGIALPLSGQLKTLGERAISGMDIALDMANQRVGDKFRIIVKDTKGNAAQGAFAIKDLIEQDNVSVVIGGLNIAEATKQYLEAKKHGVLFISLSKVLLPKEEKNHLLIEIPSSIESQLNHLFEPQMLKRLGRKPAIIYPQTDLGEAYAHEFWRLSKKNNLDITGIISYDTALSDLRDPVKNLLGIKFTRERQEEVELVKEITELEKRKSVKRLQSLQPQIDFDWVFVPTLPREAIQILPNFNYFDAFNLNYIGVPSWRSSLMINESYRYGNVYFMDEPISAEETEFTTRFFTKFHKTAKFVEVLGFDALKIYMDIIDVQKTYQTRQELDLAIVKKEVLNGESGQWQLVEDIWIKKMNTFKIKREGIVQVK